MYALPPEALSRPDVKEDSRLYPSEAAAGGYRLTPYDPTLDKQMEIAEEEMSRYRNALRTLIERITRGGYPGWVEKLPG